MNTRLLSRRACPALVLLVLLRAGHPAWGEPFEWQAAAPESQGMSAEKLDRLKESLAARKSKALLVIRNDRVVYEWYAEGHGATKVHYTASMAKALVGGVSLAVAVTDGRIGLDDKVAKYVPQWKDDPRKSKITVRQLGSHTSGLEDAEAEGLAHEKLTGWKGDFWKRLEPPGDAFSIARDRTPVGFEPGEKFSYSNPGIAMLTYAVTAAIAEGPRKDASPKDASPKDIRTLLRDRVMRPIGVADNEWSVGYGKTYTVDSGAALRNSLPDSPPEYRGREKSGLPLVASWGGGGYTARATARVGRLMLRGGEWDGKQLLSEEAVRQVTSDAGTPGHGGMAWWSNNSGRFAKLPKDAFWGSGAGHQVLLVVPSLNLIAVRNGENLTATEEHHDALNALLFEPLMEAIVEK
jgi:CubicO group peptidase (beta-lactamase class C family)